MTYRITEARVEWHDQPFHPRLASKKLRAGWLIVIDSTLGPGSVGLTYHTSRNRQPWTVITWGPDSDPYRDAGHYDTRAAAIEAAIQQLVDLDDAIDNRKEPTNA